VQQQATVISVHGGQVTLRATRSGSCSSCAGKSSCSTLGSWRERSSEIVVENSLSATVGDVVVVEVPDRLLLKVMFRLYAVPMLVFLAAGMAVRALALEAGWAAPDLLAAVAGMLGVVVTYLLLRHGPEGGADVRMLELVEAG